MARTDVRNGRPRRPHAWPLCPVTGKARFGERRDARQALERAAHLRAIAALDGRESAAQMRRAYRCPFCDGWHLTSQSPSVIVRFSTVP